MTRQLRPAPIVPRPPRPDANPLRLLVGFAGIASATAITTALLPSVTPPPANGTVVAADAVGPSPSVIHVTRVVMLQPGQTPPPQAQVVTLPTPTPRVRVVTTTRQSGAPR
jgi:hypothetical protein